MLGEPQYRAILEAKSDFWRAARAVLVMGPMTGLLGRALGDYMKRYAYELPGSDPVTGLFVGALFGGVLVAGGTRRRLRFVLGFAVMLGAVLLMGPVLLDARRHAPYLTVASRTFVGLIGFAPVASGVFVMAWLEDAPPGLTPFGRSPKLVPFNQLAWFTLYPALWAGLWVRLLHAPPGDGAGPFDHGSQVCQSDDDCFKVGGCGTCGSCYSRAPHYAWDCAEECEQPKGLACKCESARCVAVVPD